MHADMNERQTLKTLTRKKLLLFFKYLSQFKQKIKLENYVVIILGLNSGLKRIEC